MDLQDQIESFQSIVFANLHDYTSAKCRIYALAPFVLESWGIYRFVTFILRRMHEGTPRVLDPETASSIPLTVTDLMDALAPLRDRYRSQHRRLQQFYFECLNLRFLTELTSVPKLAQVRSFVSLPAQ
jgi:huntingtin-interacting protein 1-related protein